MNAMKVLFIGKKTKHFIELKAAWELHKISCIQVDKPLDIAKELKFGHYFMVLSSFESSNSQLIKPHIKIIRELTDIPLAILCSEKLPTDDLISLLDVGADNVFTLTSSTIIETVAICKALIRRNLGFKPSKNPSSTVYIAGNFILMARRRLVVVDGVEFRFSSKEFDILHFLVINRGFVLTYRQIFKKIWGADYEDSHKSLLWSQIKRIRKTLALADDSVEFIKTVNGVGYSFDPSTKSDK